MKIKIILGTLVLSVFLVNNVNAQFGVGNKIKKKYEKKYREAGEKKAEEQAEKAYEAGEEKGMEAAEKGMEAAEPGIEKAEEGMDKGAEATASGLKEYEKFQDNYNNKLENVNPEDYRKYPFESAIVEYVLEGKTEGTKSYYVDGAGYKMAEYITEKKGSKIKENNAIITVGPHTTTVDFMNNSATTIENPFLLLSANPDRDWQKTGENLLIKTGHEKTGKETIIGKECDVWEHGKSRMWIWKGLVLKQEDRSSTETATSVKLDVSVPAEKFEVPKDMEQEEVHTNQLFPDITADEFEEEYENSKEEEEEMLDMIEDMTYSEFKAMAKKEDPEMTDEEIQQAYLYLKSKAKRRNK